MVSSLPDNLFHRTNQTLDGLIPGRPGVSTTINKGTNRTKADKAIDVALLDGTDNSTIPHYPMVGDENTIEVEAVGYLRLNHVLPFCRCKYSITNQSTVSRVFWGLSLRIYNLFEASIVQGILPTL